MVAAEPAGSALPGGESKRRRPPQPYTRRQGDAARVTGSRLRVRRERLLEALFPLGLVQVCGGTRRVDATDFNLCWTDRRQTVPVHCPLRLRGRMTSAPVTYVPELFERSSRQDRVVH